MWCNVSEIELLNLNFVENLNFLSSDNLSFIYIYMYLFYFCHVNVTFIYYFFGCAGSSLLTQAFSICREWGLLSNCGVFSCCRCCKEQYCIGTWNVRSMNQGKSEVVKTRDGKSEHRHSRNQRTKMDWNG